MVLELLKYPDPRIKLISGNIRAFDDSLQNIITDMRDTMLENDLDALSAIQIGIQYAVVLIKQENECRAFINLRILSKSGEITQTERSPYYPGISVDVMRHDKIKICYENEKGEAQYDDLEGDVSRVIQHQMDYNYGGTFVDRVDKETKLRIGDHLSQGLVKTSNPSCPTIFYRDYIIKAYKLIMLSVFFSFAVPFFSESTALLEGSYLYDRVALGVVGVLLIIYAFYAYYEAEQYKQCTSCQTGNIIGTMFIGAVQALVLGVISFFWMNPL